MIIDPDKLDELASFLRLKNETDDKIALLIGRPAQLGHAGEYIASAVFFLDLNSSATQEGSDGIFTQDPLKGKTVNVKWYPRREGVLDINIKGTLADYYLVLTGPKSSASSSRGKTRPWRIDSVFLFDMHKVVDDLVARGITIGVGTSILSQSWAAAEIYPSHNSKYPLTKYQRKLISLFATDMSSH